MQPRVTLLQALLLRLLKLLSSCDSKDESMAE
jgi:hypothetical protein